MSKEAFTGERSCDLYKSGKDEEKWVELRYILETEPKECAGLLEGYALVKGWWHKESNQDGKTLGTCLTNLIIYYLNLILSVESI